MAKITIVISADGISAKDIHVDVIDDAPTTKQPMAALNLAAFFGSIRGPLFDGSMKQEQVDGCELLLRTCFAAELDPLVGQTAYVLATVYHETGARMQPVRETFAESDAQAITRLESAWARGHLPWVKTPYWRVDANGKSWFGRGHVQLTWERNYESQQQKLMACGRNFFVHDDPNRALIPEVSATICVHGMRDGDFTGKKLSDYIAPGNTDYVNARRIVNGTDRASSIAHYAKSFEAALRGAGV